MAWSNPIIDRTLTDVNYAKLHQDSVADLKGSWNVSDINRVINNINYITSRLNSIGYYPNIVTMTTFYETDLPYVNSVMDIIRNNVKNIVDSFYKLNNGEIRFGNIFDYNDANILESNVDITNTLITNLELLIRYSGTFDCGTTFSL